MTKESLELLMAMGKVIIEFKDLNTEKYTFETTEFPIGIYVIKTTTYNGYEKIEKIIKKE